MVFRFLRDAFVSSVSFVVQKRPRDCPAPIWILAAGAPSISMSRAGWHGLAKQGRGHPSSHARSSQLGAMSLLRRPDRMFPKISARPRCYEGSVARESPRAAGQGRNDGVVHYQITRLPNYQIPRRRGQRRAKSPLHHITKSRFQPTLPSKLTSSSFWASTANSMGSSLNTWRQKPLTIMFTASSLLIPR